MKKKKVIVFGAAGFVGTYLIDELLKNNYEVLASDINQLGEAYYKENNIPYAHIDITQKEAFNAIDHDEYYAVVHVAAVQPANVSSKNYDPRDYINVNVIGTLNILEFCRRNKVGRIIYASSHRNTSGLWEKDKAIRETDGRSLKLSGEYAMFSISETAAQDCVQYYGAEYGLQTILFRLPPVYGYGPYMEIFKEGKPIKTGFQAFIDNAIAGKPIDLWGDVSIGRDIVYIKDVVAAFIKALGSDKAQGMYNITSGRYLTIREQAEITAKVFWEQGTEPVYNELPEKQHQMDSFLYDNSKAKEELGWAPQYDYEDMLTDIKKEMKNSKYEYLLTKRKLQLKGNL